MSFLKQLAHSPFVDHHSEQLSHLVFSTSNSIQLFLTSVPNRCSVIPFFAVTGFFIFTLILNSLRKRLRNSHIIPPDVRLALTTFITPATCSWPSLYDHHLVHVPLKRQNVIKIHTATILENLKDGILEFRDIESLALIFTRQLRVAGWKLALKFENLERLKVLWWILDSQIHACLNHPFIYREMDAVLEHAEITQQIERKRTASQVEAMLSGINGSSMAFDLDYVPCPMLSSAISHIQLWLNSKQDANIYFTVISPDVTFLSDSFLAAAIPFVKSTPGYPSRSCSALLTPIQHYVKLLTFSSTIQVMSNVSLNHATQLQRIAQRLADDRANRTAFIEKWGIRSWREQQTMLLWEAGLLKAGILTRWEVVIHKLT